MKKIIVILLIFTMFAPSVCFAIGEDKKQQVKKTKKQKVEQVSPIEYINLDWWQEYNDEYLENYIIKAINNNHDLKIASLRVEEARQAVKMQFSKELPQLTIGASPAVFKLPESTSSVGAFAVPMIANYELDLFLKNRDKTKAQKKLHEVSMLAEKSAYISISSAVGSTYYNIVRADKLISLQETIVADRKTIYELMKQSNDEGIVSTADLVEAKEALVISESNLIELKKTRTKLLNALAVLTGDSPNNINDFKRISYDALKFEKTIPNEIPAVVIDKRPDYLIAEKMVEKAGLDVRVAKKEFLPSINISGLLAFNTLSMPNMGSFNWENAIAGLGGGAFLPLFAGGAKIANLKLNKNKYEQILENYRKTNLTAIQEVNDTLSDLKLNNEKYQKINTALDMEKEIFGYSKDKYNQGVISYLDLIQREESLYNIEKMLVSSKMDEIISQISLYNATAANL